VRDARRGGPVAELAATAAFTQVTVTRYGKTATIQAAAVTCLWHSVFGTRPVTVVLIRDRAKASYDLALFTKAQPSTADMAAKLRRVLIAARFQASRPDQPTPEEINVIRLAWEGLAP
jgi:hypothetical protein